MPSTIAWRASALDRFRRGPFDLLVIGGGINGAGIARDAALRGLSVALVERDDFASGTSSRSSRLIHGGVRYLEHAFLHLVFEASRERRTLLRIAPDLVHPLQFTWPIYNGSRIPRWKLGAGLWLYDLLALFRNVGRHKRLGRNGIVAIEPLVAREQLLGGATYWDAATDDARLTLANIVDASRAGATVLNYAAVTELRFEGAVVSGALVHDRVNGSTVEIKARAIMNATGPWTDTIRTLENPAERPAVLGTKGVHISVPADRVGNQGALIFLAPQDGREMFVLPAGSQTIIGTTDTPTKEHPDQVRASSADVHYLIDAVNHYFPQAKLAMDDVIAAWAGIRPLIASGNGGNPATASREDEVVVGPGGVISVSGGKLTTYRSMSERIVDLVYKQLGQPVTRSQTATRTLAAPGNEFACTIADVLVRRTKRAFNSRDHGLSEAASVATELAALHGWGTEDIRTAIDVYRAEIARLFTIEP